MLAQVEICLVLLFMAQKIRKVVSVPKVTFIIIGKDCHSAKTKNNAANFELCLVRVLFIQLCGHSGALLLLKFARNHLGTKPPGASKTMQIRTHVNGSVILANKAPCRHKKKTLQAL